MPLWLVMLAGILVAPVFMVDGACPVVIPIVLANGIAAWTWIRLSSKGRGLAVSILYRWVPSLLLIAISKRILDLLDLTSAGEIGVLDRRESAQSVQR